MAAVIGGKLSYVPQVNDRLALPLINREFKITQVVIAPTAASPLGTVKIDNPAGLGFSIKIGVDTSGDPYTTVGYFYRKSAYTVFNGELRYHDDFDGATQGNYVVVRQAVTSPKPFSVLFPTSANSPSTDGLALRISLESADLDFSGRNMVSGTSTVHTTIPARSQPPAINNIN